jgi:hypothetical protein
VIRVPAVAACTSNADHLAFRALVDAVRATGDLESTRIVGGHMVGLLVTAFPVAGVVARRTIDADAGVSTEVATTDVVHERLIDAGYTARGGNRLVRDGRVIDLLVETPYSRPKDRVLGERVVVRVPTVELAVVLKAYALRDRHAVKDVVDLHHLLAVRQEHGADSVGGWALGMRSLTGHRLGVARVLHGIRQDDRRLVESEVPAAEFVALVREHIAAP